MFTKVRGKLVSLAPAVGGGLALVGSTAFATGTDFSSITSGLDVSTILTAAVAVAALIAGVYFTIWGAKKLAKMVAG